MWEQLQAELIKAVPGAIVAGVSALLALGVGRSVSEYWALRQKRRELELATLNQFYQLYGEFFGVWKLWNLQRGRGPAAVPPQEPSPGLLERACAVEAGVEAILVKLTAERQMGDEEVGDLGLLRQAFQSLRKCMSKGERLSWSYSEHEEYATFKRLSSGLSALLLARAGPRPSAEEAASALLRVTANANEGRWAEVGERERAKRR